MQTTRIHFEDLSFIDIRVSDLQTEEDIARTEFIPDEA